MYYIILYIFIIKGKIKNNHHYKKGPKTFLIRRGQHLMWGPWIESAIHVMSGPETNKDSE